MSLGRWTEQRWLAGPQRRIRRISTSLPFDTAEGLTVCLALATLTAMVAIARWKHSPLHPRRLISFVEEAVWFSGAIVLLIASATLALYDVYIPGLDGETMGALAVFYTLSVVVLSVFWIHEELKG